MGLFHSEPIFNAEHVMNSIIHQETITLDDIKTFLD